MTLEVRESVADRLRDTLAAAPVDSTAIDAALRGLHPADIADVMEHLTHAESLVVFNALDDARAAEVLDELLPERAGYIADNAPPGRMGALLDRLPMDDAAEVVAEASTPARAEALLAELTARAPEDAAEVRELLAYPEHSAGRLMTDKYLRLSPEMTVDGAFVVIRQASAEIETLTDLYVVAPEGNGERLIGLINLRHLVRAEPAQRIGQIMVREPITVRVDTDQQEVARLIAQYDFLAMPVLDRDGLLAGIITVDDVIDVLVEEFNEDYLKLVGTDAEEMDKRTPLQVAQLRLPWLMATMVIELLAGGVISRFDWVLKEVILLASFMPVISAISGNVGLQAAAIIVRGLDTGHVRLENMGAAIKKEVLTAVLMALTCGVVLGTVGAIWSRHLPFGFVIGGAMCASMLTASCMGTLIPMLSKKLGFDPATSAGPFETAFQDVIGFAVFLWLASLLLPWLK